MKRGERKRVPLGKGRPPKEDSRDNQYRIRLSNEELRKLELCCRKTGLSKADVIRKGIETV